MIQEKAYSLRLESLTRKKITLIAKRNRRSLNQQLSLVVEKYIDEYEKEHGKITKDDIKSYEGNDLL